MITEQRNNFPSNVTTFIHPAAQIDVTARVGLGVILPANVTVEPQAEVEAGVVFAAGGISGTVVRSHCRVGAGAVIGPDVELGRGCEIRAGCVVLRSVPPNAIVEGNPAVIVGYTQGDLKGKNDRLERVRAPPWTAFQ